MCLDTVQKNKSGKYNSCHHGAENMYKMSNQIN